MKRLFIFVLVMAVVLVGYGTVKQVIASTTSASISVRIISMEHMSVDTITVVDQITLTSIPPAMDSVVVDTISVIVYQ